MNVKYKEDPTAWRKSTLLTVLGLAILSSLLRWRHVLPAEGWIAVLVVLGCIGTTSWLRPQWFRGYHRFSTWAGFWSSQCVARVVLVLIFFILIMPAGLIMRALGKDPLRLKRSRTAQSYWRQAKAGGSLDRSF
jgi:hypothetical protein